MIRFAYSCRRVTGGQTTDQDAKQAHADGQSARREHSVNDRNGAISNADTENPKVCPTVSGHSNLSAQWRPSARSRNYDFVIERLFWELIFRFTCPGAESN